MQLRNLSTRTVSLRDSLNNVYLVPANSDLTVSDSLWTDNEFRRWLRTRVRDVAITSPLPTHASAHASGAADPLIGSLDATARHTVQVSGTTIGTRRAINFIPGTNVASITATDNSGSERVDLTVNASSTSANLTPAAIVAPPDSTRNVIQPTGDFTALTVRGNTGQTVNPFIIQNSALTSLFSVSAAGVANLTGNATVNSGAGTQVQIGSTGGNAGVALGSTGDTNLYRSAADTLKTDDSLVVQGNLTVNGGLTVTGGGLMPAGCIVPFAGSVTPVGWLLCDGSAVSRTTYSTLFTAIGTTYGVGDGSTTFNVPDLRGRMAVGKGTHTDVSALGNSDGLPAVSRRPRHSHTVSDPGHAHSVADPGHQHQSGTSGSGALGAWGTFGYDATPSGYYTTIGYTGISIYNSATGITVGQSGVTDTPAFVTLNYIVKT